MYLGSNSPNDMPVSQSELKSAISSISVWRCCAVPSMISEFRVVSTRTVPSDVASGSSSLAKAAAFTYLRCTTSIP